MGGTLFSLLAIIAGFSLLFFGYKLARFLIPLWGFFAGFSVGSAIFADAKGTAFIETTLGVFAGLAVGIVFALLAYFFYNLAVVLLGANLGYLISTGVLGIFGINKGFLAVTIGIIGGVIFAILAIKLSFAKYLLIALTSFAGTLTFIIGLLILVGQADPSILDYISTHSTIENSLLWTILFWVLFTVGLVTQAITNKNYTIEDWTTQQGAPQKSSTYKSQS